MKDKKDILMIVILILLIGVAMLGFLFKKSEKGSRVFDFEKIKNEITLQYEDLTVMDFVEVNDAFGINLGELDNYLFLSNAYSLNENRYLINNIIKDEDEDNEELPEGQKPKNPNEVMNEEYYEYEYVYPTQAVVILQFEDDSKIDFYYDSLKTFLEFNYALSDNNIYNDAILSKDSNFIYMIVNNDKEKIENIIVNNCK